jgi:PAS domain-containing protein
MAEKAIEVILTRQLASYLATPIFIVDEGGVLVYYNEPAEKVLGLRFEDTGEMTQDRWGNLFSQRDDDGNPIPGSALPLARALRDRQPAHGAFWIHGLDGQRRRIAVTAFPLIGQGRRNLGAMAVFWEAPA